jgi:hypothetical protein
MAILKKSEIAKLTTPAAVDAKIKQLELSLLELEAEGKSDRTSPLKKAIATLLCHAKALKAKKVN